MFSCCFNKVILHSSCRLFTLNKLQWKHKGLCRASCSRLLSRYFYLFLCSFNYVNVNRTPAVHVYMPCTQSQSTLTSRLASPLHGGLPTGSWSNVEQAIVKLTEGIGSVTNQTLKSNLEESVSLVKGWVATSLLGVPLRFTIWSGAHRVSLWAPPVFAVLQKQVVMCCGVGRWSTHVTTRSGCRWHAPLQKWHCGSGEEGRTLTTSHRLTVFTFYLCPVL